MSIERYELTDETVATPAGVTLHRIRALVDMPWASVRAGDLGGWVESKENLYGATWVYGDARVYGNAWVSGDARA
jgi:hypothetical protein